jgi:hypothetical protein
VIPGLISTHNHVGYTMFRGRAEDAGLGCVTGQYFPMTTVVRAHAPARPDPEPRLSRPRPGRGDGAGGRSRGGR